MILFTLPVYTSLNCTHKKLRWLFGLVFIYRTQNKSEMFSLLLWVRWTVRTAAFLVTVVLRMPRRKSQVNYYSHFVIEQLSGAVGRRRRRRHHYHHHHHHSS